MRVLIIGDGGREWALAQNISKYIMKKNTYVLTDKQLFSQIASIVPGFSIREPEKVANLAKELNIDLTIVGPEIWLEKGIVDEFHKENLTIFGPSQKAAQVETSKEFAKKILFDAKINTANYSVFEDELRALDFIRSINYPIVIKDDSLCSGKGVTICQDYEQAKEFIKTLCKIKHRFIIEEFLTGTEFSHFSLVWKNKAYEIGVAKDHKRLLDNDKGPNTGGMGVISPLDYVDENDLEFVRKNVVNKFLDEMSRKGIEYSGFLYSGLIKDDNGKISVIEFNARMGDPECEILMPLFNSNIAQDILDLIAGKEVKINLKQEAIIGVVVAHKNYPYDTSELLSLPNLKGLNYMPMGLKIDEDNELVTNAGRVIMCYEKAPTLEQARETIYNKLSKIDFKDFTYRRDI